MKNPHVPSKNLRWSLDRFFTNFGDWEAWGGFNEIANRTEIYDVITSEIIDSILDLPSVGTYTIKTSQYRPDLISADIYNGSTEYWQIILMYNGIIGIDQLVSSREIRYPSLNDLENLLLLSKSKPITPEQQKSNGDGIVRYNDEDAVYGETLIGGIRKGTKNLSGD